MSNEEQTTEQAPVLAPSPEQVARSQEGQAERTESAGKLKSSAIIAPPDELKQHVSFVAAKKFANARWLVVPGKLVSFPDPKSPSGKRDASRDGDVWCVFKGGVMVTDDKRIIDWCLARPTMFRDASDPRAPAWAQLKEGQAKTASSEPTIPPEFPVDATVYPEQEKDGPSGSLAGLLTHTDSDSIVQGARDMAASANEKKD